MFILKKAYSMSKTVRYYGNLFIGSINFDKTRKIQMLNENVICYYTQTLTSDLESQCHRQKYLEL